MKVVVNKSSGKKHLPGEESTTLCGSQLIQDGKENASWEDDWWLDEWPEDYGDSPTDCKKCAEIADLG